MKFYITILLLASSAVTFAFGVFNFYINGTALFKIMITSSIGCFMLGKIYDLVNLFSIGEIYEGFNVGMIATIGGFLFIFSSSFSQLDWLVDDRSKSLMKYRVIALLVSLSVLLISIPVIAGEFSAEIKICTAVMFIFISQAFYFNFKHIIVPDISFGIITCIRGYNITALLLELLTAVQLVSDRLGYGNVWAVVSVLIAAAYPCLMYTMVRGSKKWTA